MSRSYVDGGMIDEESMEDVPKSGQWFGGRTLRATSLAFALLGVT